MKKKKETRTLRNSDRAVFVGIDERRSNHNNNNTNKLKVHKIIEYSMIAYLGFGEEFYWLSERIGRRTMHNARRTLTVKCNQSSGTNAKQPKLHAKIIIYFFEFDYYSTCKMHLCVDRGRAPAHAYMLGVKIEH